MTGGPAISASYKKPYTRNLSKRMEGFRARMKGERMDNVTYYNINEDAARRAREMNSFYAYKPGSATEEYKTMVDKAAEIAEAQKAQVDPIYHEKIDSLLDTYARKLAKNMNDGYAIDARVPSVMIAGPANLPPSNKE